MATKGNILATYFTTSVSLLYTFPHTFLNKTTSNDILKPSEVAISKAINITFRASFGRPAPNSFDTRMLKTNKRCDQAVAQKQIEL